MNYTIRKRQCHIDLIPGTRGESAWFDTVWDIVDEDGTTIAITFSEDDAFYMARLLCATKVAS